MVVREVESRHVCVWGPPSVGKSKVGRRLAKELGIDFVDLDEAVEERAGRAIDAMFAEEQGEARFRELEREVLGSLLSQSSRSVIALGGGTLVHPSTRREVLARSLVVTLRASSETLHGRVAAESSAPRPLLAAPTEGARRARLEDLLASRAPAYAATPWTVATDGLDPEQVATQIAQALASGVYPIAISESVAYSVRLCTGQCGPRLAEALRALEPTRTFIVTDETVASLHLASVMSALEAFSPSSIVVAAGEANKTAAAAIGIVEQLAALGADRRSVVVGLGGGVVTDMTGLAASLFARGIRWVAVPTTVVGMVDAAIGGKTGVNLPSAKNALGTFHHPSAVLIDSTFCMTESERAVRAGLAEAVKSAAIADARLFDTFEADASDLKAREPAALDRAIRGAVAIKAAVVEADPSEIGARAILNFGHTVGHALETASQYELYSHGEAVSIGMVIATRLGRAVGITPDDVGARVERLLVALGLPTQAPLDLLTSARAHLRGDKKRVGDILHFVVLTAMGEATVVPVTEAQVASVLEAG